MRYEVDARRAARLVREPLTARVTATEALRVLRGDDRPFALIGAWAGGGAILGSEPVRVAGPDDDVLARLDDLPPVECEGAAGGRASGLRPRRRPGRRAGDGRGLSDRGADTAGAVGGGWVGHLGFELRHAVEPGHPPPPRPAPLPDAALAFYDHVLRLDGAGRWWFEALWTPERAAALEQRRAELAARLAAPPPARPFATSAWRWTPSPAGHAQAVEACRERIAAGDLFQANLCLRLDGRLEGEPLDLFAAAVAALPTDRAAFLAGPWGALASLSPELFLAPPRPDGHERADQGHAPVGPPGRARRVRQGPRGERDDRRPRAQRPRPRVPARRRPGHRARASRGRTPACGTSCPRSRGSWPAASATPTWSAPPSRPARSPARRSSRPSTSSPSSRAPGGRPTRAPSAWRARSPGSSSASRSARSRWPASGSGSASAAAWWPTPRAAPRRARPPPRRRRCSPPSARRCRTTRRAPAAPPRVVRRGPRPVPRPDPAAGLYETVLVADGTPLHLDEHLARLAASLRALYGRPLPPDLSERIATAAAAAGAGRRRLRVDVTPELDVTIATGPPPARRRRRAPPRRPPGRARGAQVARPPPARGARGRRPRDDAAAARRGRPRARGQPGERRRARRRRPPAHPARRRAHPAGHDPRAARPGRARRSPSRTCAPPAPSTWRARCAGCSPRGWAEPGSRRCCPARRRADSAAAPCSLPAVIPAPRPRCRLARAR